MDPSTVPSFHNLPKVEGMPQGCAWGLFDKEMSVFDENGESKVKIKDQIGTLNFLTDEHVLNSARSEIRTGERVTLDWELGKPASPLFGRCGLEHKILDFMSMGKGHYVHDDELRFNPQAGSQWDGFRHFGHQKTGLYYNSHPHSLLSPSSPSSALGIQHFSSTSGGIVGRGILLDYIRFLSRHPSRNPSYHPMKRHVITVADLNAMIEEQGVEVKPGDILIVRSGFVKWYERDSTEEERRSIMEGRTEGEQEWAGVEGNGEMVEWLWDHHFAAVAGDSISFEQWPFNPDCMIHEYQLALWGSPIGEIWNLERLAQICERENRWSFFFTSAPLNVPGGVSSPPNAICIF